MNFEQRAIRNQLQTNGNGFEPVAGFNINREEIARRLVEDDDIQLSQQPLEQRESRPLQFDATGRMMRPKGLNLEKQTNITNALPSPTHGLIDKEALQKALDFNPKRGGGDLRNLLKFGREPEGIAKKAKQIAKEKFRF